MATLKVGLVSPEREIWSGEARTVVAQTIEGSLGILPGHAPVLGILLDGSVVKIEPADGGEPILAAVGSGFFSVAADEVSVLAEQVERGDEIDVQDARQALDAALSAEADSGTPERRARARLRAAGIEA
ncbi:MULTISPECIES: F0F1 ATP synthase subunit epsilon [Actinomadura]|uniref:ATP synthase epsilon chain n=1 Tax=Actinomadura madurae TaxID=1993 RepID=A0A1I5XDB6_9ACTN|nr:F0F1 ATP synthase subunit epsilon [Actinomadura madurae]MCP9953617.1 F0F1 ATP synthase subunit epsilon [Actinomadura madurae]MCP9982853.1 F0F1 ATP synthase subunit epsilon [Actinomadura madurae]MCQ0005597.1 F0F1 ATP synthase subunit epsilon [Actinomadura madurae]MCQ0019085.1 F0F1 ATP synthase subunit epsilon [Actinomadura madurae]URM99105.1 F0F1 ATP synthase subunit epsilon [Actinomadura madurae]